MGDHGIFCDVVIYKTRINYNMFILFLGCFALLYFIKNDGEWAVDGFEQYAW